MKYRILRAAKRPSPDKSHRIFRLCASQTLSRIARHRNETIDFSKLFEISDLPDVYTPKKPHPLFTMLRTFFSAVFARIGGLARRSAQHLREKSKLFAERIRVWRKKRKSRKKKESLPLLCGALCSSLLVSLLLATITVGSLLGGYGGIYRSATVPALIGLSYEESMLADDDRFSIVVDYVYNPEVTPGHVISQSPPAGVTRRIYSRGKPCTLTLTVSCANPTYTLTDLVGLSRRDALLELRNHGVRYEVREIYSDQAPAGTVIASSPKAGSFIAETSTVTLTVSRGKSVIVCAVPSLVGLSEMQATSRLQAAGLSVGQVTYVPSDRAAGTVLSQNTPPSSLVEQGSTVSLTVSAGYAYHVQTVPSLYGMTTAQAEAKLREYGLVLGHVTVMGGDRPSGTIVAQSPLPDTPITSSIVAVDVYLGS